MSDEELEERRKQAEAELAKRLAEESEPAATPVPKGAAAAEGPEVPEPSASRPKRRRAPEESDS
ncbi:hypothetical protein ABZ468_53305 [Streptomyces sp. NPDC005708]|uniref:hypothetical protein n=1 Tax=Streptomyces sp. NPDC005708 TaxID=3154564 RepID=UPI0033DB24F9